MKFEDVKVRHAVIFPPTSATECGEGWAAVVDRFLATVAPLMQATGSTVTVVRQDMGALRILDNYPQPYATAFVRARLLAEFRSRTTCEVCGEPGHMRKAAGWYRCRCDEHATASEREEPPRPSYSIGRDTSAGYLWYDAAADDVKIVDDLTTIGMPPSQIERLLRSRENLPPRSRS